MTNGARVPLGGPQDDQVLRRGRWGRKSPRTPPPQGFLPGALLLPTPSVQQALTENECVRGRGWVSAMTSVRAAGRGEYRDPRSQMWTSRSSQRRQARTRLVERGQGQQKYIT